MTVYEPSEDSYLLARAVKKHAHGRVLDMGTGSGILAVAAAKKGCDVLAVDLDEAAVAAAKKQGITAKRSDLFSSVTGKFDTIIFNPPYLPQDKGIEDSALYGGKKGHETVVRFLENAGRYLTRNGHLLLLFSSLTNKAVIDRTIEDHCFVAEEIARQKLFMETLHVYTIAKSPLLRALEKKKVTDVRKFAKGKRGIIWQGKCGRKKVAVKAERKSAAMNRIPNEIAWLKRLNKKSIGPKLLFHGNNWFCYAFVDGVILEDIMNGSDEKRKRAVAQDILQQCRVLDMLNVTKAEMQNPWKNIIVGKKNVLIDFERCRYSAEPKNVTQFCQYLARKLKKQALRTLAKAYKKDYSDRNFREIIRVCAAENRTANDTIQRAHLETLPARPRR